MVKFQPGFSHCPSGFNADKVATNRKKRRGCSTCQIPSDCIQVHVPRPFLLMNVNQIQVDFGSTVKCIDKNPGFQLVAFALGHRGHLFPTL